MHVQRRRWRRLVENKLVLVDTELGSTLVGGEDGRGRGWDGSGGWLEVGVEVGGGDSSDPKLVVEEGRRGAGAGVGGDGGDNWGGSDGCEGGAC